MTPQQSLLALLDRYHPPSAEEAAAAAAVRRFVETTPDCLLRSHPPGHLTASAAVTGPARDRLLLIHHRKLERWLQPGGHADGDPDLLAVARREVREETGLSLLRPLSTAPFDLDVHLIPARPEVPAHLHYDVRFLFEADPEETPTPNHDEVHGWAWVELSRILADRRRYDRALHRLAEKLAAWQEV
jgi:8-oxo-dGTP pyrophosphatase MutT (NUDIX family)